MRSRCHGVNNTNYAKYGGRGITIAPEWDAYTRFVADMGERPEGTSLDRIDVNGNYEPGNCRWASPKTQTRNRRGAVTVNLDGVDVPAAELAESLGLTRQSIYQRLAAPGDPARPKAEKLTITVNGKSLTRAEWAAELGIPKVTLQTRLNAGWSEERAVTTPLVVHPGNSPRQIRRRRTGR